MKKMLVFYFILLTIPVFSQIQTRLIEPNTLIKLALPKDSTSLASRINISRLTVLDSRDDTNNIGYHNYKANLRLYMFNSAFNNELSNWLSGYLKINEQNKTGTTLLVNVKKLRVSNEISPKKDEYGHAGQPNNGWDDGIILKIEYYLQKDSFYTPLYRFDSIIASEIKFRNKENEFIMAALKLSLDKLFTINLDAAVLSKNKILFRDIIRVNNQRYDFPIHTQAEFKKGVYKTFDEFKMNAPSLTGDFEFKKGELGDILYIKEGKESYPARDVWGFCDGVNYFINSGDKYSKLIKTGYSFYFEGIKSISRKTKHDFWRSSAFNYATNSGVKTTEFEKEVKYYQVDMETGEVY